MSFASFSASSARPPVPVVPRAPLPQWDSNDGSLILHHDLAERGAPIPGRSKRFFRSNFSCVTVPGAPFVYGWSSERPDQVAAWYLNAYPEYWQHKILEAHAARGYTHFQLSRGGAYADMSIPDYVEMAKLVKSYGLWVGHFWIGKFDPQDHDASYYKPLLDPWIDALGSQDLIDWASVGWELNLFNGSPMLASTIDYVTSRMNEGMGIPTYVHFSSNVTAWEVSGGRGDFWRSWAGRLTGLLWQSDPTNSTARMQAHFNDAQRFDGTNTPLDSGFGHPFDVVPYELRANEQFYAHTDTNRADSGFGRPYDEDFGDLTGRELLCTPGPVPAMGFGNGARNADGTVI